MRNDVANSTTWIRDVPFRPRDDMDMCVLDGLTRCTTAIQSDVHAIAAEPRGEIPRHAVHEAEELSPLVGIKLLDSLDMPARHDERVAIRNRKPIGDGDGRGSCAGSLFVDSDAERTAIHWKKYWPCSLFPLSA